MGCTEPIAVAYAGVIARHTLGALPDTAKLIVSEPNSSACGRGQQIDRCHQSEAFLVKIVNGRVEYLAVLWMPFMVSIMTSDRLPSSVPMLFAGRKSEKIVALLLVCEIKKSQLFHLKNDWLGGQQERQVVL